MVLQYLKRNSFLLFLFIPFTGIAQNFAGSWSGFMEVQGNRLPYELVVGKSSDKLQGYSLTVFTINGVENTGIKSMKIRSRKEELSLEDDQLIYNDFTTAGRKITLYATLNLAMSDTLETLQGTFYTRAADRSTFRGTIWLTRKAAISETRLTAELKKLELYSKLVFPEAMPAKEKNQPADAVFKPGLAVNGNAANVDSIESSQSIRQVSKDNLAFVPAQQKEIDTGKPLTIGKAAPSIVPVKPAAEMLKRKTEVLRTIEFESDSLVLSLYDNGEVDGDTVSVVMNEQVFIARQRLSSNSFSITYYLAASDNDSLRLIMYAENLGLIPPNTGVLMIQDGDKRYQVRFEGDYKRNSAVILRRKKK